MWCFFGQLFIYCLVFFVYAKDLIELKTYCLHSVSIKCKYLDYFFSYLSFFPLNFFLLVEAEYSTKLSSLVSKLDFFHFVHYVLYSISVFLYFVMSHFFSHNFNRPES